MANKKLKKVSGGGIATTLIKTGEVDTTVVKQHNFPLTVSGKAANLNVVQNYEGPLGKELTDRINE